jgi:pimeloyl-ACP methyl ester carboxylesterase
MWIDSEGARLAADDSGPSGAMPIVVTHGLTSTRRHVLTGSDLLEQAGMRVVAFDTRGHGESSPADDPRAYTYPELTRDLECVMDDRGIERAVLLGVSIGAHTALRFALASPDRVAALVVVTPGFDPDRFLDPDELAYHRRMAAALRKGIDAFAEAYPVPDDMRPTRVAATRAMIRMRAEDHHHPQALADMIDVIGLTAPFESLGDLAAIEAPALVVATEDRWDPDHPYALAERYAAALPDATFYADPPGARPLAWRGDRLSELVLEFLAGAGIARPSGAPAAR